MCRQPKWATRLSTPSRWISARYTLEAVEVLFQIASAHLLMLCQALDLRAIEIEGRQIAPPDATPYMGPASRRMYRFIRMDLGVLFLGEDTPDVNRCRDAGRCHAEHWAVQHAGLRVDQLGTLVRCCPDRTALEESEEAMNQNVATDENVMSLSRFGGKVFGHKIFATLDLS